MSRPNVQQIESVLRREVPEFGLSRDPGTLFGTLCMLLASVALSAGLAAGLTGLLSLQLELDVSSETYLGVALAAPLFGLLIGYATRNSTRSIGSEIADNAARRDTTSWTSTYGRDDQSAEMGLGCFLFLVQALGGGIWSSLNQLAQLFRSGHTSERELAVSIVAHLLENGAIPTADLARSLEGQGVSRELVASTLRLLRKAAVLEPTPERLSIAPFKRDQFAAASL